MENSQQVAGKSPQLAVKETPVENKIKITFALQTVSQPLDDPISNNRLGFQNGIATPTNSNSAPAGVSNSDSKRLFRT
jgi:hypothetical protein